MLKYIPLQLVLFQIIGILIGLYLPFQPSIAIIALISVLILFTLIYAITTKRLLVTYYFTLGTFLIYMCIGIASVTFKNQLYKKNHYVNYLSNEQNRSVLVIDKVEKSNRYYEVYDARVVKTNSHKALGKIKLNILKDSTLTKLNVDERIIVFADFMPINKPLNPYEFNYKNYLARQHIHHQMSIRSDQFLILGRRGKSLKGQGFSLRKRINKALKQYDFEGNELAIINALLLGQRQDIPKNIIENYQNAGAVHLLAVSGLHIGILLLLLHFLLRPLEELKYGIIIKLIFIISFLWFFAFVAGLSASVVRAVTMYSAVAIGLVSKNSINSYKTLLISIFFLLLFNPNYILDVGFQLSYLAVFFIIWLQPMLYGLWKPELRIVNYFWQLLSVSVAAQIGVVPLSLFYFHQFPGLFFVANLAILPFLGFILAFGIIIILLAVLNILPEFVAMLYEKVIFLLNATVSWIAEKESFLFQNISFTLISVILSYLFLVAFFKWCEIKKPRYLRFALFFLILFQINLIMERLTSITTDELVIFNKPRHSVLGIRNGKEIHLSHTLNPVNLENEKSIKAYTIGAKTRIASSSSQIKNVIGINNKRLLVIDSSGFYLVNSFLYEYVLLRASPKINLEHVIKNNLPDVIIADASNFKSYISRWEKTCKKYNIRFHYTVRDGAFLERF